jgi:hypothetical protein
MDAQDGQDSIDLFGANFKVSEDYDKVYGKDRELLLYFDWLIVNRLMLKLYNDIKVVLKLVGI